MSLRFSDNLMTEVVAPDLGSRLRCWLQAEARSSMALWNFKRLAKPAAQHLTIPLIDRNVVFELPGIHGQFCTQVGTPTNEPWDWLGIAINAPRLLSVTPTPDHLIAGPLPPMACIWGTCRLPLPEEDIAVRRLIKIVALDVAQRVVYAGTIHSFPSAGNVHVPRLPDRPQRRQPSPSSAVGGPFTVDLITTCGIPLVDADYDIFAAQGVFRSNVIDVQIRFSLGDLQQH